MNLDGFMPAGEEDRRARSGPTARHPARHAHRWRSGPLLALLRRICRRQEGRPLAATVQQQV
ncbi:MAG TPA: hypothetical protein PLZ11_16820, partial [Thauera sp.]|nr:hypothetical protein [Thauera sp.]